LTSRHKRPLTFIFMTSNQDDDERPEPDVSRSQMADNAYIGFSIKARDTEANRIIHQSFKEGARKYTDNDYTQYLRRLMENAQEDWKYREFYDRLDELEQRIMALEHEMASSDDETDSGKNAF